MKCPGQDSRFWKQNAIYEARCPKCEHGVEFFKDDTVRRCPNCGHRFVNPEMDFGCAAYCQFAEQCLGALPEEVKAAQQDLLKDKVGREVRGILLQTPKRLRHAQTTAGYAERLGKDAGGDLGVIIMSAHLLHLHDAHAENGPETGFTPESVLRKLEAPETVIEQVRAVLDQALGADDKSPLEARVVHDAYLLASLQEGGEESGDGTNSGRLLTDRATSLAREVEAG